jgi:hypothetical protein
VANLTKKRRNNHKEEQLLLQKRKDAYIAKYTEYMGKTLEELQEIFKSEKPGDVHKLAIVEACRIKLEEKKSITDAATTEQSSEGDNNIQQEQSS